jgi:hypothetical protein
MKWRLSSQFRQTARSAAHAGMNQLEIIECASSKRTLSDVSLCVTKRSPLTLSPKGFLEDWSGRPGFAKASAVALRAMADKTPGRLGRLRREDVFPVARPPTPMRAG